MGSSGTSASAASKAVTASAYLPRLKSSFASWICFRPLTCLQPAFPKARTPRTTVSAAPVSLLLEREYLKLIAPTREALEALEHDELVAARPPGDRARGEDPPTQADRSLIRIGAIDVQHRQIGLLPFDGIWIQRIAAETEGQRPRCRALLDEERLDVGQ